MAVQLLELWAEIWPNLAADVVALAAGGVWHHRRVQALLTEERSQLRDLLGQHHQHIADELREHRAQLLIPKGDR
jgi:hypothetical protein